MARNVDLRELIPEDERDTITFRDGKTFEVPQVGVTSMGRLLMLEEALGGADTFAKLADTNAKLVELIRDANPGKEVPDYDLTVEEIMEVISVFAGAESAAAAVREALAADKDATDEDAQDEAQKLAEAAGTSEEGDDPPLASQKRSRPRSSRSAPSGSGGRNGGTDAAGGSSKPTSATRSKSKSA